MDYNILDQDIAEIPVKDNSTRAKTAIIMLYILLGLTSLGVLLQFFQYLELSEIQYYEWMESDFFGMAIVFIFYLDFIIFFLTIITFLLWFRRAYYNLHQLDLKYLKYNDTWAVASWFIPVINLIHPYQIMTELWEELPEVLAKKDKNITSKSGAIVTIWWILYIVSFVVSILAYYSASTTFSYDEWAGVMLLLLFVNVLEVVAILLLISIIKTIAKWETDVERVIEWKM